MTRMLVLAAAIGVATATPSLAAETLIGTHVEKNGMEIGAVYLQPIVMEPKMPGMAMDVDADIHLEADIHGIPNNGNGFGPGDWIPYLRVTYRLEHLQTNWKSEGVMVPMVASDGPHYGLNLKMDGPGNYRIVYKIEPPSVNGFYRHTDPETGVDPWWAAFELSWDFAYFGVGKKGAY